MVDTNLFAYAEDLPEPAKRAAGPALIRQLRDADGMAASTRGFNEFCAVLMRGAVRSVSGAEAQ